MKSPCTLLAVTSLLATMGAGAALANPSSLMGSTWYFELYDLSGATPTLLITYSGTAGVCPGISGWMTAGVNYPTDSWIDGYYCPATGEVSFIRNNTNAGTYQVYNGQIMTVPAQQLYGASHGIAGNVITFGPGYENGSFGFGASTIVPTVPSFPFGR
jgi:hypothetical protein